jgi:hypothetical protein
VTAATETPSALLRRAADRLDELLTPMPYGPRRLERRLRKGTQVLAQLDLYGPPLAGGNLETHRSYHPSRRAQAEYELAAQPDTMRDVAGMLRSVATMADGLPETNRVLLVRHALNAARRILGESP